MLEKGGGTESNVYIRVWGVAASWILRGKTFNEKLKYINFNIKLNFIKLIKQLFKINLMNFK